MDQPLAAALDELKLDPEPAPGKQQEAEEQHAAAPPLLEFGEARLELLAHGVVVIRGLLDEAAQRALVLEALGGAELPKMRMPLDTGTYQPLSFCNWPARFGAMFKYASLAQQPPGLEALGRRTLELVLDFLRTQQAQGALQDVPDKLIPPQDYASDSLRTIIYPERAELVPHLDMHMGFVLTLSLGCEADFYFTPAGIRFDQVNQLLSDRERTRLRSGDLVWMQGQFLHHGISRLYPETMPRFYVELLQKAHGLDYDEMARRNRDPADLVEDDDRMVEEGGDDEEEDLTTSPRHSPQQQQPPNPRQQQQMQHQRHRKPQEQAKGRADGRIARWARLNVQWRDSKALAQFGWMGDRK